MLPGFFRRGQRLDEGLRRTRASFFGRLAVLLRRTEISDELWDDLEELLIAADAGAQTTSALLDRLRARHARGEFRTGDEVKRALQEELLALLVTAGEPEPLLAPELTAVLVIGVNGVGKTTTIAKLGNYWQHAGRRVLLAAADTFRAAGVEQLEVWAQRIGLPCVGSQTGSDPAAMVYDAIAAAKARGFDAVIIDTAGRLHTKTNLMEELSKIQRVIQRHDVPSRCLLVLDATIGQNAILQARSFARSVGVNGIAVAKLDGTARGGAIFSIVRELGAPVRFLGTGESVDDIAEFDAEEFVGALFAEDEGASEH